MKKMLMIISLSLAFNSLSVMASHHGEKHKEGGKKLHEELKLNNKDEHKHKGK